MTEPIKLTSLVAMVLKSVDADESLRAELPAYISGIVEDGLKSGFVEFVIAAPITDARGISRL